jgi:peptide chain release factor 3
MVKGLLPEFDYEMFISGNMTPIWFGSAINSFGVKELLDGVIEFAPPPQPRPTIGRKVEPTEKPVTGFVFKVQANMDQKHRDRVAFVRLCSGHFTRGMKLKHLRSDKSISISNPVMFMANEREIAEDARAGDIIGIPNHGQIRLGDSFSEGEKLQFTGLPIFAPEFLKTVISLDPMKSKHLEKALTQFAEEGMSKLFKPLIGSGWVVGVVGILQFDVLESRIKEEYGLPVRFENSAFTSARWVDGDIEEINRLTNTNKGHMAVDHDQDPVFLTRLQWDIDRIKRDFPLLTLQNTKEMNQNQL